MVLSSWSAEPGGKFPHKTWVCKHKSSSGALPWMPAPCLCACPVRSRACRRHGLYTRQLCNAAMGRRSHTATPSLCVGKTVAFKKAICKWGRRHVSWSLGDGSGFSVAAGLMGTRVMWDIHPHITEVAINKLLLFAFSKGQRCQLK